MKYTKGEWNYSKHGNNDSFGVYAEGQPNDLAIVKGGNEEGGEGEANAKLIAAAPEMLETLKEALDQLQSWNSESEPTFTMRRIEETIQKATL